MQPMFISRILLTLLILGFPVTAGAEPEGETPGEKAFLAAKCNTCHGVEAASIAPKAKSEKMQGPDLGGFKSEADFATIAAYTRKAGTLEGKKHKNEFKGSDEELQAILDWLTTLESKSK